MSGLLERAQLWLVRLAAFGLPLVVLWSTNDQVVLPKLLAARLFLLILAAVMLTRWYRGEQRFRRTPLDLPILAYVASAGMSTVFAANVNLALFGSYGRLEGFVTIATYALLFWLTAQSLSNAAEARGVVRALMAGAFVVSLIAVLQTVATTLTAGPSGGAGRATATFGNPNALAAFLAMALPLGINELLQATKSSDRVLGGNLVAMVALALVLTLGRGAWVGAAVGSGIVIVTTRPSLKRVAFVGAVAAGVVVVIAVAVTFLSAGGPPIVQSASTRLTSLLDPTSGTAAIRLHIWTDTLGLIGSQPLVGYGPDNFGLVYPRFQTGPWAHRAIIDEAHSEFLQIAATQGVIGLAAFSWLCIALLRLWSKGRRQVLAGGVLGACAGYVITGAFNFSVVPAALPFWMFLGAATVLLRPDAPLSTPAPTSHPRRVLPLAFGLLAVAAISVPAIAMPYAGDSRFRDALATYVAGDRGRAAGLISDARAAQPQVALYAAEAGNVAMDRSEWAAAREAYGRAAELGSFDPTVFRQLAIADHHLGLQAEAVAAARRSVELGRFDPRNQAVLEEVSSP